MKNQLHLPLLLLIASSILLASCGGGMTIDGNKNMRVIQVERELPFPADTIWNKIFMDYGGASKFNPNVVSSGYLGEKKDALVGAERFMYNDEEGKEGIHERIVSIDEQKMILRFKIYETIGLPVDTEVTYGESQLVPLAGNKTLFKVTFQYRTVPKFLANFAHGSLTKDFERMTVGIEHYLTSGEEVTAENFDDIADLYE